MQRRILLLFGLLSASGSASASAAADSGRFDGRWGVILVCPKAPDGALPLTFEFTAAVRQAMLHGEHGLAGGRAVARRPDPAGRHCQSGSARPDWRPLLQHQPDHAGRSLRTRRERPIRRLARRRQLAGASEQRPNPHLRFHLYQAVDCYPAVAAGEPPRARHANPTRLSRRRRTIGRRRALT